RFQKVVGCGWVGGTMGATCAAAGAGAAAIAAAAAATPNPETRTARRLGPSSASSRVVTDSGFITESLQVDLYAHRKERFAQFIVSHFEEPSPKDVADEARKYTIPSRRNEDGLRERGQKSLAHGHLRRAGRFCRGAGGRDRTGRSRTRHRHRRLLFRRRYGGTHAARGRGHRLPQQGSGRGDQVRLAGQ